MLTHPVKRRTLVTAVIALVASSPIVFLQTCSDRGARANFNATDAKEAKPAPR